MLRNVFYKTLKDQYRGLIGWGIATAILVVLTAAIWPSVHDMKDLEKLLAQYPEAMQELFSVESMSSGRGFLNAELFSLTIPVLFLIFAISRGVRLTASEETDGTFEILLTMSLTRRRILIHKAAALTVSIGVLAVVVLVSTAAVAVVFDMSVGPGPVAVAALSMALLGIEHGLLALAVGAATGNRALALAVTGGFAVAGYMFYALGAFVDVMEPWRVISPFFQALEGGPIGTGLRATYLWMPVIGIATVVAALPMFSRRDIAV